MRNKILLVFIQLFIFVVVGLPLSTGAEELTCYPFYQVDKTNNVVIYDDCPVFGGPIVTLDGADALSFERISGAYGKDKNNVYFKGEKIEDADAVTFASVFSQATSRYAKDKNHVYENGKVLLNRDSQTFEYLQFDWGIGDEYTKDKNGIYINDQLIEEINPKTFEYLGGGYVKDGVRVYLRGVQIDFADTVSFEVLTLRYSKDKHNVYVNGQILSYADSETFTLSYCATCGGTKRSVLYAQDKKSAYYGTTTMALEGFEVLGKGSYAKNKYNLFYKGQKLTHIDVSTLEITSSYFKDKNGVYARGSNQQIKDLDPITFEVLDKGYAKDKATVYFYFDKIVEADVKTFTIVSGNNHDAQDKQYFYKKGKIVEENIEYEETQEEVIKTIIEEELEIKPMSTIEELFIETHGQEVLQKKEQNTEIQTTEEKPLKKSLWRRIVNWFTKVFSLSF